MGNTLSEEEEKQILDEAYNLEDPDGSADRVLNNGTAAPNCQPKHTAAAGGGGSDTTAVMHPPSSSSSSNDNNNNHKHRRAASTVSEHAEIDERRKRQQTSGSANAGGDSAAAAAAAAAEEQEQQKKLSYYQMAKLGYQELVNAIIRPPRADYKVRFVLMLFSFSSTPLPVK
mmetsp:Transcript_15124/g.37293  ORF Transcript_15124/g.37293 Transcript_15124/m.37293 type:complete len:172 (+) Transcript_15124:931-1446(+)